MGYEVKIDSRVREFRSIAGLSQKELGNRIGIGRSTISEIENGKYVPALNVAYAIAYELNTSIYNIFPVKICSQR